MGRVLNNAAAQKQVAKHGIDVLEENFIADPEDVIEEPIGLERGELVYKVSDPECCGIITGILLDINDCVTFRVNDKFYYADELTLDNRNVKKVPGFNGK